MARKSNPQPLTLSDSNTGAENNYANLQLANSPLTSTSPTLLPRSPLHSNPKRCHSRSGGGGDPPSTHTADGQTGRRDPSTPTNTSSVSPNRPPQSAVPATKEPPGAARGKQPAKGGFFSNYKASKSNNTVRQASDEAMSRETDRSAMAGPVTITEGKKSGSKPDKPTTRRAVADPAKPDVSPSSSMDSGSVDQVRPSTSRKAKPKPFRLLSRSKSIREQDPDQGGPTSQEAVPIHVTQPSPRIDRVNTFDLSTMSGSLPSQEGDRLDSEMGSLRSNQRSDGSLKSHLRSERSDDGQPPPTRDGPRESKKHRDHSRETHAREAHVREAHAREAHARENHVRENHVRENHVREAYGRDAHGREAHARDAHARDAHAREAHAREPHAREPHAREPHAREPHARENHGRDHGRNIQPTPAPAPTPASSSSPSTLFNAFKANSSKAVQNISKGIWAKVGRSTTQVEKEPVVDDEHYVLKVINLPLVEQTRLTRISKKLEKSRDKTEFWMPAFPWRAIDYLNYNGSEVEGLYRVPGSGPQIKKWQRKFDEEHDVDLFAQDDLYDINIVGSMFKAWLRELPDEIFPRACQDRIARECAGAETVPQMLIDELSNLPPFNYYLLFAVTCHLSLLLAHQEKNKMDFRNLCICFQPCMRIDRFCFRFLVENWRDCWKGCKTEQYYIEQEYSLFDPNPGSIEGRSSSAIESIDDRSASSPDSSKPSSVRNNPNQPTSNPSSSKSKPVLASKSYNSIGSNDSLTTADPRTPRRNLQNSSSLRPLSPIKPLSPMGF